MESTSEDDSIIGVELANREIITAMLVLPEKYREEQEQNLWT